MRDKGKIQIGFHVGLQLGQSNPVKSFNAKEENGKETSLGKERRYFEVQDNKNVKYS
jgi:hypothetical protein